jgi:hypothetical protein
MNVGNINDLSSRTSEATVGVCRGWLRAGRNRVTTGSLSLALLAACSADRPQRGTCNVDLLEVTWPATIDRGGATTSERLSMTLAPTNVTPETFDTLTQALVRGKGVASAILWSVPAFNTDPGGIAVAHPGRLRLGQVLQVGAVMDSAGWGVLTPGPPSGALVGVEAGEFVASSAKGSISVLETEPLALRFDVTAADSTGATIRLRGDAQFSARRERRRCEDRGGNDTN